MLIKGEDLTYDQATLVLNSFPYRWTSGNPARARIYGLCPHCNVPGGEPSEFNLFCRQVHPTVPLISDNQWLKEHAFHFVKDGSRLMANRRHCEPVYMAD